MYTFKIVTVVIVAVIMGLFAVGAYKAEKILDSKAKEMRQSRTPEKSKTQK